MFLEPNVSGTKPLTIRLDQDLRLHVLGQNGRTHQATEPRAHCQTESWDLQTGHRQALSRRKYRATASAIRSTPVQFAGDILLLAGDCDVVGVDEAQFFDDAIVDVCNTLANAGKRVIVAGLDMDFEGKPFYRCPTFGCCRIRYQSTRHLRENGGLHRFRIGWTAIRIKWCSVKKKRTKRVAEKRLWKGWKRLNQNCRATQIPSHERQINLRSCGIVKPRSPNNIVLNREPIAAVVSIEISLDRQYGQRAIFSSDWSDRISIERCTSFSKPLAVRPCQKIGSWGKDWLVFIIQKTRD